MCEEKQLMFDYKWWFTILEIVENMRVPLESGNTIQALRLMMDGLNYLRDARDNGQLAECLGEPVLEAYAGIRSLPLHCVTFCTRWARRLQHGRASNLLTCSGGRQVLGLSSSTLIWPIVRSNYPTWGSSWTREILRRYKLLRRMSLA